MRNNTLQERWESFQKMVIPPNAPPVQIREMKLAFYAGAESFNKTLLHITTLEKPEQVEVAMLEGLNQEIKQFLNDACNEEPESTNVRGDNS